MRTRNLEIDENILKKDFHISFVEEMAEIRAEHIESLQEEL
ncbi:hypothetical protein [Candidatus Amoebophilus asiaticus]|nr:hypothetical protein [Candidatus Amoebophilus asiaticus]